VGTNDSFIALNQHIARAFLPGLAWGEGGARQREIGQRGGLGALVTDLVWPNGVARADAPVGWRWVFDSERGFDVSGIHSDVSSGVPSEALEATRLCAADLLMTLVSTLPWCKHRFHHACIQVCLHEHTHTHTHTHTHKGFMMRVSRSVYMCMHEHMFR